MNTIYVVGKLIIVSRMKQMAYVDGTKCNSLSVGRKRPPTSLWTAELLSERETEELNFGGFGFGEIEGPFVEQEDPMPDTIEVIRILTIYIFLLGLHIHLSR